MKNEEREVLWTPHPGPQTEALTFRVFETLYGGARGGGKTDAGIMWMLIDTENPKYRGLVIRKNANDLTDWVDRARVIYTRVGAEISGSSPEIKFSNGAIIRTGHLKDDSTYEKYQGHEYHRMLIEELTQIPFEERYLKLTSSCRSTVEGLKPRIFSTANPGGHGHQWVKKRFVEMGEPMKIHKDPVTGRGRIFIPATVDDNPTLMKNDPGYVKFLEGLPDNLRKAWRYGDWSIFAGQYFSEWLDEVHVVKPFKIPDTWRKIRAIDHGRTAPTAAMWGAVDHDGAIYWYREYYSHRPDLGEEGRDADVNAQNIAALSLNERYWFSVMDSACFSATGYGETIADIYRMNGVMAEPWPKHRIAGWNLFHEYLRWSKDHKPKMKFFSNCTNAIRTIPMLIHEEKQGVPTEDVDSTGEDHAADAIRGALEYLYERETPEPLNPLEKKLADMKRIHTVAPTNLNKFYGGR